MTDEESTRRRGRSEDVLPVGILRVRASGEFYFLVGAFERDVEPGKEGVDVWKSESTKLYQIPNKHDTVVDDAYSRPGCIQG